MLRFFFLGVLVTTLPFLVVEAFRDDDIEVPFEGVSENIQNELSQAAQSLVQSTKAQADITKKVVGHIGKYHKHVKNIASTMAEVMRAKNALTRSYHEDLKRGEESRIGALEVNLPDAPGEEFNFAEDFSNEAKASKGAEVLLENKENVNHSQVPTAPQPRNIDLSPPHDEKDEQKSVPQLEAAPDVSEDEVSVPAAPKPQKPRAAPSHHGKLPQGMSPDVATPANVAEDELEAADKEDDSINDEAGDKDLLGQDQRDNTVDEAEHAAGIQDEKAGHDVSLGAPVDLEADPLLPDESDPASDDHPQKVEDEPDVLDDTGEHNRKFQRMDSGSGPAMPSESDEAVDADPGLAELDAGLQDGLLERDQRLENPGALDATQPEALVQEDSIPELDDDDTPASGLSEVATRHSMLHSLEPRSSRPYHLHARKVGRASSLRLRPSRSLLRSRRHRGFSLLHRGSRVAPAHMRGGYGLTGAAKARALYRFGQQRASEARGRMPALRLHRLAKRANSRRAAQLRHQLQRRHHRLAAVDVRPRSFQMHRASMDDLE